jgi:hypothetical protein
MKSKLILIALAVALALTTNCKKVAKNDDDTTTLGILALAYINDQQSGNCATVTKTGTSYYASFNVFPKFLCSLPLSREEAVNKSKAIYSKVIDVYSKAGSVCDSSKNSLKATSDGLTVNSTLISASLNSYATEDLYVTNFLSKTKAYVVTNFVTEAANTLKTNGFVVANTSPGSLDQFYLAYASLLSSGGCKIAIEAMDITFFNAYNNDPKTKVLSSSCNYGTGSSVTNSCATLSEQF